MSEQKYRKAGLRMEWMVLRETMRRKTEKTEGGESHYENSWIMSTRVGEVHPEDKLM